MSLKSVTAKDFEVYEGKWFEKDSSETKELQGKLGTKGHTPALSLIAEEGGIFQERFRDLGYRFVYEEASMEGKQKRRWRFLKVC